MQGFRDSYVLSAHSAAENNDYRNATETLEAALSLHWDPVLEDELQSVLAHWEEYEYDEYDLCVLTFDLFNERLKTHEETLETIATLQSDDKQAMDILEPQGNYLAGKEIIFQGLKRFPDNDSLLEALAFYQQFEPVRLSELTPIATAGGDFRRDFQKTITDSVGRTLPPGSYLWGTFDRRTWTISTTYMIRGAFTDFTGTIAVPRDSRKNNIPVTVRILGDGQTLLEQENVR